MNRREFVGFAALARLVASAADLKSARADRPFILLPDSARVCDIGREEALPLGIERHRLRRRMPVLELVERQLHVAETMRNYLGRHL